MSPAERLVAIASRLREVLVPANLEVVDESHLHVGHVGARDGRGHFFVRIQADCFVGLPPLARHRAIYAALGDLMTSDIHALRISAMAPDETQD